MLKRKKKRRITVSSAKAKGRSLQQWVCKQIDKSTPCRYGNDDDADIKSRPMGQNGTDVILNEHARSYFPFSVECKSAESWNVMAAIDQVKKNMYPGTDWLVVLKKKDLNKPIVVIDAELFFKIYEGNTRYIKQ